MKHKSSIILFLCFIPILGIVLFVFKKQSSRTRNPSTANSTTESASPISTAETQARSSTEVNNPITYPIDRYTERLTKRSYGEYFTRNDNVGLPCGGDFSGWHTGDDLEIFPDEIDSEVVVVSIADGKIREAKTVGGYGGLIVIEHTINDRPVTAYYGHIDIDNTFVKKGDMVIVGQKIAFLGENCTKETSGERKHIHFAIHKGLTIDYRGYVNSKEELESWISPMTLLK